MTEKEAELSAARKALFDLKNVIWEARNLVARASDDDLDKLSKRISELLDGTDMGALRKRVDELNEESERWFKLAKEWEKKAEGYRDQLRKIENTLAGR